MSHTSLMLVHSSILPLPPDLILLILLVSWLDLTPILARSIGLQSNIYSDISRALWMSSSHLHLTLLASRCLLDTLMLTMEVTRTLAILQVPMLSRWVLVPSVGGASFRML